jgi:endoglucanase
MKNVIAVLFLILSSTVAFAADVISLKRGLPSDIWLSWPDAEGLDDPALTEIFPEYRRTFKGNEFKDAKAAGFDFVRFTIDPAVFLYNRRPEKTAKLIAGMKIAIAEIHAAGLKVDVDLHSMPRKGTSPGTDQIMASEQLFDAYLGVVSDIGEAIADLPPDQVAFEPMNEPTTDCEWELQNGKKPKWPAMLERMHKVARAAAPKLTLILSGGCWGGPDGLVALDPKSIVDKNVIWSFHNYEPFVYTHQSASWNDGHERYLSGLHFPPDQSQKLAVIAASRKAIIEAELTEERRKELLQNAESDLNAYFDPGWAEDRAKQPFYKVEAWAKAHNIPASRIIMGEFGATREEFFTAERQKERAGFYGLLTREAEKRGYGWSTWSWSGGMGLTVTDTSRVFDPVMLKALGLQK